MVLHSGMEAAFVHAGAIPQLRKALVLAARKAGEIQQREYCHEHLAEGKGEPFAGGASEGASGLARAPQPPLPPRGGPAEATPSDPLALRFVIVWGEAESSGPGSTSSHCGTAGAKQPEDDGLGARGSIAAIPSTLDPAVSPHDETEV